MQLSTKGRYSVMAIVEVARQEKSAPLCLGDIAQRLNLSLPYLEQLFMKLRKRGLVASIRGPGGGYVLARQPASISIGEIMAAVDEPVNMTRCSADNDMGCVRSERCATHYLWDALGSHIEQFLTETTLDDILYGKYSEPQPAFPAETKVAELR